MAIGVFLLMARVMIAAMFIASGYAALSDISGTTGYFAALGLPFAVILPYVVGLFELAAGAALVLGFMTRPVAALLAAFAVTAGYLGHYGQGDDATLAFLHGQMLMKDIAVAGGLIAFAVHGAGRLSFDALRG